MEHFRIPKPSFAPKALRTIPNIIIRIEKHGFYIEEIYVMFWF